MPTPPTTEPSWGSGYQPGSHGRGVWTQQPPATGILETEGMEQGGRQAEGQGPSLLFGKALRPAPEVDLGRAVVGRRQHVEQVEAGERAPSAPARLPRAEIRRAPGRDEGRRHVAGAGAGSSHCASLGPHPRGCPWPYGPPHHGRGQGLVTGRSAP